MQKQRCWRQAMMALASGLEARHLQRRRTLATVSVEAVVLLNLASLVLLLAGQSV